MCEQTYTKEKLVQLKNAIANSYYFEMYVEDLPMSGFIGDIVDEDVVAQDIMGTGEGKTYLFPHLLFTFGMNKDRIVSATVHTDSSQKVDITNVDKPLTVSFIGTFRKGLHYKTWIYPCSYCHHLLTDIWRWRLMTLE